MHMVNHAGHVAGPKAIVDVDDCCAAGTGIEHRKQGGKAVKGSTIADTGRNSDHWTVSKAANDTG